MGDDAGPGAGAAKPAPAKPPPLPDGTPKDIRDFVSCTSDKLELKPGKINWLPVPISPTASFEQPANETNTVRVKLAVGEFVSATVPISITDGEMSVDTSAWPDLLAGKEGVDAWVRDLNGSFKGNGKRFGKPTVKDGKLTLAKEKIPVAGAASPPPKVKAGLWSILDNVPKGARVGIGAVLVVGLLATGIAIAAETGSTGSSSVAPSATPLISAVPSSTPAINPTPSPTPALDPTPSQTPSASADFLPTPGPGYAPTVVSVPRPLVFSGCIASRDEATSGVITPTFVVENGLPGVYSVAFESGPTGRVSGTATLAGDVVAAPIVITTPGSYESLVIFGPDRSPLDPGPLSNLLPFVFTPKASNCDAATLPRPPVALDSLQALTVSFTQTLGAALASGDTATLYNTLNQAVIERYGEAQCRGALAGLTDPTAAFTVKLVGAPAPFVWSTDGLSTSIPDTLTVDVARTRDGQVIDQQIHLPQVDAQHLSWLTDCGVPFVK